jgi:hypothetical protein
MMIGFLPILMINNFGPKPANGKQSLLFVSDNNFSDKQKRVLLLK